MLHVRLSISVCVCVFLSVCVYFKMFGITTNHWMSHIHVHVGPSCCIILTPQCLSEHTLHNRSSVHAFNIHCLALLKLDIV